MSTPIEGVYHSPLTSEILSNQPNTTKIGPTVFLGKDPGGAEYMWPVGRLLMEKGVPVFTHATGVAEGIFSRQFPGKVLTTSLPKDLDWIFVSASVDPEFELDEVKKILGYHPRARVCVAENVEGSVDDVIQLFLKNKITPARVLAFSHTQAGEIPRLFPELSGRVVPVGQPAFDKMLTEDAKAIAEKTRKKLDIPLDSIVVTYAGTASQDHPGKDPTGVPTDLNSLQLAYTWEAFERIFRENPGQHFTYIYKPHPREEDELGRHPLLQKAKPAPNAQVVMFGTEYWKKVAPSTQDVCAASQLVAMPFSTVGGEVAFRTAVAGGETGSALLYLSLPEFPSKYEPKTGIPLVLGNAAARATTRAQILVGFRKYLLQANAHQSMLAAQEAFFKKEFGDIYYPSAKRVLEAIS